MEPAYIDADNPNIKRLLEGNARFVLGQSRRNNKTDRLAELAANQQPFAIALGCSDSRVPVETVFDQEPGDMFVIRVAGNYAAPDAIASIEYAVEVLRTPLLLVLGHSNCGAVTAAVDFVRTGRKAPGHIHLLADAIEPAARAVQGAEDWIHAAVGENVRRTRQNLCANSPILAEAVTSGRLAIAGAVYDLRSGVVSLLE